MAGKVKIIPAGETFTIIEGDGAGADTSARRMLDAVVESL